MNCPRCEGPLDERVRDGVTIDVCARCRGIWLDRGELEKLIAIATADDRSLAADERPGQRREERFFPPSGERVYTRRRPDDSDARPLPDDPERRWHHDSDAHRMPAAGDGRRRKRRWYESIGDLFD